jgi:hypothetical protein
VNQRPDTELDRNINRWLRENVHPSADVGRVGLRCLHCGWTMVTTGTRMADDACAHRAEYHPHLSDRQRPRRHRKQPVVQAGSPSSRA